MTHDANSKALRETLKEACDLVDEGLLRSVGGVVAALELDEVEIEALAGPVRNVARMARLPKRDAPVALDFLRDALSDRRKAMANEESRLAVQVNVQVNGVVLPALADRPVDADVVIVEDKQR